MYHRVTTRIDLMPYNNISHIQSILCFITTGRASRITKLGTYFFVNQIVCLRTRIGHLTFRALQIVVCARVYANVCLAMLLLNILGQKVNLRYISLTINPEPTLGIQTVFYGEINNRQVSCLPRTKQPDNFPSTMFKSNEHGWSFPWFVGLRQRGCQTM